MKYLSLSVGIGLVVTTVPLCLCCFPVFWHLMNWGLFPFAELCKLAVFSTDASATHTASTVSYIYNSSLLTNMKYSFVSHLRALKTWFQTLSLLLYFISLKVNVLGGKKTLVIIY